MSPSWDPEYWGVCTDTHSALFGCLYGLALVRLHLEQLPAEPRVSLCTAYHMLWFSITKWAVLNTSRLPPPPEGCSGFYDTTSQLKSSMSEHNKLIVL